MDFPDAFYDWNDWNEWYYRRGDTGASAVGTILYAMVFLPILIVSVMSFCLIRRRKDPLRWPFVYLNIAFGIILSSFVFQGIAIVIKALDDYSSPISGAAVFSVIAELTDNFALCLVPVILYGIATSILHQHAGPRKWHMILRASIWATCAIVAVMAIVSFGVMIHLIHENYGYVAGRPEALLAVHVAMNVLHWLMSLGAAGLGFPVIRATSQSKESAKVVRIFIAAAFVWLVNTFYVTIISIRDLGRLWPSFDEYRSVQITYPIFAVWTVFVVLVLVYVIGRQQQGGIWSAPEVDKSKFVTVRLDDAGYSASTSSTVAPTEQPPPDYTSESGLSDVEKAQLAKGVPVERFT